MDQLNNYEAAAFPMVEAGEQARASRAELLGQLAGCFARREPRLQAGKYIDGLLSDLPRKNGWTLAEHAGDATPDRMHRLLNQASWDHRQAMAQVRGFVFEHLAGPDAVLVLDESGQEKAGCATRRVRSGYARASPASASYAVLLSLRRRAY